MVDYESALLEHVDRAPAEASKLPEGGRARILAVARTAFVERGYADVSMQEIANAAGLTKAAIYYHFTDKEALFEQVVVDEINRICDGVEAQIALGPPLQDQIERVARFAFESGRGDFGRLLDDVHRYCGQDRRGAVEGQFTRPYMVIRAMFEEARARGEIRDVDLDVTVSLFFSVVGNQMKGAEFGPVLVFSPAVLASMVADFVMRGIAAES